MPNIIIKNEYGTDEVYENVEKVRFRTQGGAIATFKYNNGTVYQRDVEPEVDTDGAYHVIFYDALGEKLKEVYVDEGEAVSPPTPPVYDSDYLEFDGWVKSGDYTNVTQNITAIAHYRVKDAWQWTRAQDGTSESPQCSPSTFDLTVNTTVKVPFILNSETAGSCSVRLYAVYNQYDSYGYLYDSDGTTILAQNDDGYGSGRFLITYTCQFNHQYYLGVRNYSTGNTGRVYGNLEASYAAWNYSHSTDGKVFLGNLYTYQTWKSLITEDYDTIIFRCGKAVADVTIPPWIKRVYYADTVEFADSTAYKLCYQSQELKLLVLPEGILISTTGVNCMNPMLPAVDISSVASIPSYVHAYRRNLKALVLGTGITDIGTYAFYDSYHLKKIIIPDTVTSIGAFAFAACHFVDEISIGNGVTAIGNNAFYSSSPYLKRLKIPDSVTSIGSAAFRGFCYLETIDIGIGITTISNEAFYLENTQGTLFAGSRVLKDLYVRAVTPPTLGSNALNGRIGTGSKIHVPADALSTYATASGWSAYSSYMVGDL